MTIPWAPQEADEAETRDCPDDTTASVTLSHEQQEGQGLTHAYECETVPDA